MKGIYTLSEWLLLQELPNEENSLIRTSAITISRRYTSPQFSKKSPAISRRSEGETIVSSEGVMEISIGRSSP